MHEVEAEVQRIGDVHSARGMTITAVEAILLSHDFPPDQRLSWSGGTLPGVTAGLIRITTAEGVFGIGETYAGTFAPEVVERLVAYHASTLVGEDPSRISDLWTKCYSRTLYWGRSGIAVSVLSGIESALWDLCGKALDVPVYKLLGGDPDKRLLGYASGGMDASDADLTAEQERYVATGFRASKIRTGRGLEADVHKVEVARNALGPSAGLAIDAVQGSNPNPWNARTATEVGKACQRYDLMWYEEPCAALDIEGYVQCRRELDVPIAGGETLSTAREFMPFFKAGAFDIVQPDAAHSGGIMEALKIARLAQSFGMKTAMHSWGSGVGYMANAHVGFAAESCQWLEYPTTPNPMVPALLASPLVLEDGKTTAPQAPGLGVQLPPDVEERFRYRPGNHYQFAERR